MKRAITQMRDSSQLIDTFYLFKIEILILINN